MSGKLAWINVTFPFFYVAKSLSVCFSNERQKMTPTSIFGGLNFANIAHDPNFKEDSVREEIITPILKRLGYLSIKSFHTGPRIQYHQKSKTFDYVN